MGEASALKAMKVGFADVTAGPNNAQGLVALIVSALDPESGPAGHLSGETLAFDLKLGARSTRLRGQAQDPYRAGAPRGNLPPVALAALREQRLDAVIFMSPRTARTFADLLDKHGAVTQGKRLVCYCLSQAVAEELGAASG